MVGRWVALRVISYGPTATRLEGWIVALQADGKASYSLRGPVRLEPEC